MSYISPRSILKQVYWDLIGKDSQRGISLTYAWMCNQWGHIALGFIPAMFMGVYGDMHWLGLDNIVIAGLLISVIATVFEAYNFLVPLLSRKDEMTFSPDWAHVGFDTFTDLSFFYIGGLAAIQVLSSMYGIEVAAGYGYALLAAGVYAAAVSGYWYTDKMYLQAAGYPLQMRLSQWMFPISPADQASVLQAVRKKEHKHILIFGLESTGKTGLAVAVATEFSIKRTPASYTTASKLCEMLLSADSAQAERSNGLWTWRNARCLVIDDINTGKPVPDIITPGFMRPLVFDERYAADNIAALSQQTVIWVIGSTDNRQQWEDFIREIGVQDEDVLCIDLSGK